MKNITNKVLAIISIIILLGNIFTTTVYGILEDNESLENEKKEEQEVKDPIDDEEPEEVNEPEDNQETKEIDEEEVIDEELQEENVIEDEEYGIEETSIDNEEFSVKIDISGYQINTYYKDNIYYLFVPQGVDISNLNINYTGNVTNVSNGTINSISKVINNNFSIKDTIEITANDINYIVKVMQSNLPSITISLNGVTLNEINQGSKSIKYPGNTVNIAGANDSVSNGTYQNVEMKGRGNFTWRLDKKAYQIKFDRKVNLFGNGSAKKWVLLANHADASLMRNQVAYDFAEKLGLPYSIKSQYVDLWVDGEYIGNYMACHKVEVGKDRVNLKDENGVLIELDNTNYGDDPYIISKETKTVFALKDSKADDVGTANSKSMESLYKFEKYVNEFESLLYSDNKSWERISKMIDVESFVKYYFVQEFTEDPDGCRSSVYMYKDGDNDVIHMGPIWDYDSALGNYTARFLGGDPTVDYVTNIEKYMGSTSNDWYTKLFEIKEFRQQVLQTYQSLVKTALASTSKDISKIKSEVSKSANMNFIKNDILGKTSLFGMYAHNYKNTYAEEVKYLSNWVEARIDYLNRRYSSSSDIIKLTYSTHVQDYGWNSKFYCENGETSGTSGQSKRVEAIKINLTSFNSKFENADIKYQVHVQDKGWMNWVKNGEIAGTSGEAKRVEAIRIKLENVEGYKVEYRVHVQDKGWMDWVKNGEMAGTSGESKRIEAIEIRIKESKEMVLYSTHIQDVGWEKDFSRCDGEMSGTSGQSKRLEAIKIKLGNIDEENVNITYQVHAQDKGWMDWVKDGGMAGTLGESKRLESIRIKLENSAKYTVQYRVHIQDVGWTNWISEGEEAGTTGQSKRLEGIEIQIVEK